MKMLWASSISSFRTVLLVVVGSWPRITALSALWIWALRRTSTRRGEPLMMKILGNLLIVSQISVGMVSKGKSSKPCLWEAFLPARARVRSSAPGPLGSRSSQQKDPRNFSQATVPFHKYMWNAIAHTFDAPCHVIVSKRAI